MSVQAQKQGYTLYDLKKRNWGLDPEADMRIWLDCVDGGEHSLRYFLEKNRHVILENKSDWRSVFLARHFYIKNPPRKPIFVCAAPKSGSTSFSQLLASMTGRPISDGHNKNSINHTFDARFLTVPTLEGSVIHSHMRPTCDFIAFLMAVNIIPIVLLRNVFDAIQSRNRHDMTSTYSSMFKRKYSLESAVYKYAYEYLSFASDWMVISQKTACPIFYFEDNVRDWPAAMKAACDAVGAPYDDKLASAVMQSYDKVKAQNPRKFRVTSRKAEPFPRHLVDFVLQLASEFEGTDLGRILKTDHLNIAD
jgi:hypothetical protein